SDGEIAQVRELAGRLDAALQAGLPPPEHWVVIVATYLPLHTLANSRLLLAQHCSEAVRAVIVQQVREHDEELAERDVMPRLTRIDDPVSRLVQEQYEENPYPRWIKVRPVAARMSFDDHIRSYFPFARFRSLGKGDHIDILVAGCGTGQHA